MPGDVIIRDANAGEAGEIGALLAAAYAEYMPPKPRHPAWDAYEIEVASAGERFGSTVQIVAERDGKIVGSVTYYPPGARAVYPGGEDHEDWPEDFAAFRLLGVHPDARGLGVGRLLTDECVRRARVEGAVAVGLHTTELMKVARAMYERMGWERAPEYDFYPIEDFVVMAYRLSL